MHKEIQFLKKSCISFFCILNIFLESLFFLFTINYMMNQVITAFLISLAAGLATSIGGVLAFILKKDNMKALALGLSFSAGVMIYISFMEILPESMNWLSGIFGEVKGSLISVFVLMIGILIAGVIDYLMPDHVTTDMMTGNHKKLKKVGIFAAIAVAVHNFPEGLATFMTGLKSISLSIPIAIAIALHNIPEGISVALPIYNATGKKRKAFFWACLSGMAEPLGAILGFFLLRNYLNDFTFGILFALIAGIMIYLSLDELLPLSREYDEGHQGIIGVSLGIMVMAFSMIFV